MSHHPPVSVCHAESKNFIFHQGKFIFLLFDYDIECAVQWTRFIPITISKNKRHSEDSYFLFHLKFLNNNKGTLKIFVFSQTLVTRLIDPVSILVFLEISTDNRTIQFIIVIYFRGIAFVKVRIHLIFGVRSCTNKN